MGVRHRRSRSRGSLSDTQLRGSGSGNTSGSESSSGSDGESSGERLTSADAGSRRSGDMGKPSVAGVPVRLASDDDDDTPSGGNSSNSDSDADAPTSTTSGSDAARKDKRSHR